MTAWDLANLDPRGLIGRTDVGDHQTLLHTKHISCGSHGFREENIFKFYFHYKSMRANDHRVVASLGLDWQDLCR